jgi:hypothetical protein
MARRGNFLWSSLLLLFGLDVFNFVDGGVYGGRRRRREHEVCDDVPETVFEDTVVCSTKTKIRTVRKEVTKMKEEIAHVTKYENRTRKVNQTKAVDYYLDLKDFYADALQLAKDEIRSSLQSGSRGAHHSLCKESETASDDGEVATILYGPTQAGKTTAQCQLLKYESDECGAVGDGTGKSVTMQPSILSSKIGMLVDTPGNRDTELRFTNEAAGRLISLEVAAANITQVKFMVFDSMANDAMHLKNTLEDLLTAFGPCVTKGVVVIASKANLRPGPNGASRLALMRDAMAEQGLQELVAWPGPKSDEGAVMSLEASLRRVPAVKIADLEDLWQRQRKHAVELWQAQPLLTKFVDVEVDESYVIERVEEVLNNVPYIDHELVEEPHEVQECPVVPLRKTVLAKKCRIVQT